jgi:hypothetical protein
MAADQAEADEGCEDAAKESTPPGLRYC